MVPFIPKSARSNSFSTLILFVILQYYTTNNVNGVKSLYVNGDDDTDRSSETHLYLPISNEQVKFTTTVIDAKFGRNYNKTVNATSQILFVYNYNQTNQTSAIRVSVESVFSSSDTPVMVFLRQKKGVMSWTVPLYIDYNYAYSSVSRTLCPKQGADSSDMAEKSDVIYVEMSSMSPKPVPFTFRASLLPDFHLSHGQRKDIGVSPSSPQYYMYTFPDHIYTVMIQVTSDSSTCMVVSIQDIKCPVYDLDMNYQFAGKYQTMSTQAAILLEVSAYSSRSFYVVLIVKPHNLDCAGIEQIQPAGTQRRKNVTILVKETIHATQYYEGVFGAVGFFMAFYVIAAITLFCSSLCEPNENIMELTDCDREKLTGYLQPSHEVTNQSADTPNENDGILNSATSSQSYGSTIVSPAKEMNAVMPSQPTSHLQTKVHPGATPSDSLKRGDSLDESEVDFLRDAEEEKEIFRTKTTLFVSDLARKSRKKLANIYKIYHWNLFTIAIFYGLPVAQLVITYQKVLVETGNQDLCYYNFDCVHPFGVLSAFNNVFSNIGYVLLGILFILLVRRRDVIYKNVCTQHGHVEKMFGIPQHFGLFYAMGLALIMEGILSGCYHVCPNYSNFQFDTSFMYIIACLCMLKIYQSRHPDINAKAYQAYLCMALVIFITVIGVVYVTSTFWIVYGVVHMMVSLLLTAQIYYMGRWTIDRYIFKRMWNVFVGDCLRCSRPTYLNRFVLLLIGNVINWSFAIYGAIEQPGNFASYLLAIFIGNLLLYCLFYIIMKMLSRERLQWKVIAIIVMSIVTWGGSLYFFFANVTSWQETPAGSRRMNRDCILLNFYDSHDVWHFLSAISLFLSFLILLVLDDDLNLARRDRIPVF